MISIFSRFHVFTVFKEFSIVLTLWLIVNVNYSMSLRTGLNAEQALLASRSPIGYALLLSNCLSIAYTFYIQK